MPKSLIAFLALLMLGAVQVFADTYSWVDQNGTAHFTDDPSSIPKKFRSKATRVVDVPSGTATPSLTDSAKPASPSLPAPSKQMNGAAADPAQQFGGKTFGQWQQGLAERESALNVLRIKIDEMDRMLKKPVVNAAQYRQLLDERNRTRDQFTDQRKEYDAYVESARKAGLKIDMAP